MMAGDFSLMPWCLSSMVESIPDFSGSWITKNGLRNRGKITLRRHRNRATACTRSSTNVNQSI